MTKGKAKGSLSIEKLYFASLPDGKVVDQYILRNSKGMKMKVLNFGCIINSLKVPDRNGHMEDIVLGYDNLESYRNDSSYFGAIVGRYGNRIAKGKFTLDGIEYLLAKNNGENHLHGGSIGFNKVLWDAEIFGNDEQVSIKFSYLSVDMEEGYPGNLEVFVTYTLDNKNQLLFEYSAHSDKKTILNLTQHSYYNLSGNFNKILDHEMVINANEYLSIDSHLIPMNKNHVGNTPFDFRKPKSIGKQINQNHPQLKIANGYDHCFLVNPSEEDIPYAASAYHPISGRLMEVYTTEPGVQFYTGNFLDGKLKGKNGTHYPIRSGFCLETQHFPDSPNRPDFPKVFLNPGEKFTSKTLTKFSIK